MMDRTVDATELSIGVIDHFTSFAKDPCVDEFNASQFIALDFIPVVGDSLNRSYSRCPNDPLSSSSSIASSSFASSPNDNLHYTALLLLTFPLITLFGNVLVCLSVCVERSLRSVTNYFIVSLAIADILVAILVMPPAIYVEVNNSVWQLGDPLCDVWVAADVLCCTASILNLTAISFDRYIAITQPLFYARHKKSKRGHVMLAMTWIISVAISAPIVLGINYTDRRRNLSPNLCTFYNADFIIVSSMGSFYIPCILMLLLYCRMFRKIHLMARQSIMRRKSTRTDDDFYGGNSRKCSMEESKHPVRRSSSRRKTSEEDEKPEDRNRMEDLLLSRKQSGIVEDDRPEVFLKPFKLNQTVSSANSSPRRDTRTGLDVNDVFSRDNQQSPSLEYSSNNLSPSTEYNGNNLQSERIRRYDLARSARMSITKLNSYLRHLPSQSRRDRSATKRERKVTKTLVIVLVVFLFCWAPFFTVNIINAICIRFNLFARWPVACHINPSIASAFVWLGYINSFINPIIYTIFNIEFRRAFDKLLTKPCSFLTNQKRPFSNDDLVCMSNI